MNANVAAINLPVLLVGALAAASAVTYLLRSWERTTALVGAAYAAVLAVWLWRTDFNAPLRSLGLPNLTVDMAATFERLNFTLRLEPGALPILSASLLLVAGTFVLAASISQGRSFVPFMFALLAGYAVVALLTVGPLAPPLITPMFLAGLSIVGAFILQAGRRVSAAGPLRSFMAPLFGFPLFLLASWYIEQMPFNPQDLTPAFTAAQLMALGLIVMLAPAPLHGAQPATAQTAPPLVAVALTLLYQLAVLHLLFRTVTTFPFTPQLAPLGVWLTWAGLITAVWGGFAAAGANHAGRLLGYTSLHDWGLIVLVLAVPGSRSWPLVLFLFGLHAVSLLTAAVGMSVLEQNAGGLQMERLQGAGSRMPWNSAAYLLGGLGLAGFPLSAGFTGHWAALQIVAESDWRPAAVVLLASGGAILGFIRLARLMYGPLADRMMLRENVVNVALAVLVLLLSASLAVAPQILDGPLSQALRAFSN